MWHNGGKQRGTYGEKFATGDVVRLTIDLKKGTLSYALNGKDLGIAFGPGGTGPKLNGPLYPAFASYNQKDCIELIGGHRVEEADVAGPDDDALLYDSADDLSEDAEEEIPATRITLACELSALGFPIEWCLFALKNCEDDTARAADFILSNIGSLEEMVQDEAEERNRRQQYIEDRRSRQRALASSGTSSTEPSGTTRSSIDKWGVKFTAIPEFTIAGRRLLALKHKDKLEELHKLHSQFTLQHDEAIVSVVDEVCGSKQSGSPGSDPLRLAPDEVVVPPECLSKYPCLNAFTIEDIQSRFLVLRNFNLRLQSLLPFVDFTVDDQVSVITRGIRLLRGLIFRSVSYRGG